MIDTNNQFKIYKIGKRVFQIGFIDYDYDYLNKLADILDNGFKFIPCYHVTIFDIFKNLLFSFDNNMFDFNKQLFFKLNSKSDNNSYKVKTKQTSCNDIDCFIKNCKRNYNTNVPFLEQSINFQIEILKELDNFDFGTFRNLSKEEILLLKDFTFNRPLKVVELDKNIGAGLISKQLYNNLCYELLDNEVVYTRIDFNPLNLICKSIEDNLLELFENLHISEELFISLIPLKNKLGNFRILPKLHKNKFSSRPIINYKDHPTTFLCMLVDLILRPFVKNCDSYIQDSQNLIQKSSKKFFPTGSFLATCDFESLYSNIDHNDCLKVIGDFLKDKLISDHINITGFIRILKLILDNNYFSFDKSNFYFQKLGIAMGSKCGPSIANIYVYCYEKLWLNIHRPLFYARYIDDIFIVVENLEVLDS